MNNLEEKRERMLSMIADWHRSGKSKKAYCAENGINEATFYYLFSRSKENDTAGIGSFITIDKVRERAILRLFIPMVCVSRSKTMLPLCHS
ncbi:IS66 family insertion sequence element accessory protein TnpB [uncultured Sphingobacterium sp.]|uniref:IS66 family insertion sequence element accessory protein TnpA n=1 Tax=uncultured Sphingobacterium sp. TaxID=182688 RepID=UPI0025F14909|nr:IS66 family insertion sequence element accessory protein TnpB [uncultured Sphingobacterium sp.]